MPTIYDFDVIIIGAGPAGCAAAIRLLRRRPSLAGRVLVMDKAVFPRPKLCGGGITRGAEAALDALGVIVPATAVSVTSVEFRFPTRTLTVRAGRMWPGYIFKVVRRETFDHALLREAARYGAVIHEGEAAKEVSVASDAARIYGDRLEYRTRVVIAADGANSLVRRGLGLGYPKRLGAASEMLIPAMPGGQRDQVPRKHALFDFGPILSGLQGYYWEFPTIFEGAPMVSAGVADSRILERPGARSVLTELLDRRGGQVQSATDVHHARGAPMRWFHPRTPQSVSRVLFAGDAAGAEPLFNEGISTALEFGIFAADAVVGAFDESDFSFAGYDAALLRSGLGRALSAKLAIAQRFYASPGRWQYVPLAWPSRRFAHSLARVVPNWAKS